MSKQTISYECDKCGWVEVVTGEDLEEMRMCSDCNKGVMYDKYRDIKEVEASLDIPIQKAELLDTNPKTIFGAAKPALCLIPRSALVYEAMAFKDGADKYGAYNWRERAVSVMTYLHAAARHEAQYLDGEDYDLKSLVHHLGHARACLGIILDALECGNAIDDRPKKVDISALLDRFTTVL